MGEARKAAERSFAELFAETGRALRGRLLLRSTLQGAMIGLGVGVVVAGSLVVIDRLGLGRPFRSSGLAVRPWCAALALLGGGIGFARQVWRRPSDRRLVLELDRRLAADQALVTALDPSLADAPDDVALAVLEDAREAIAGGPTKVLLPPVPTRVFVLVPLLALALIGGSMVPLLPVPLVASPPGSNWVQGEAPKGLEEVKALAKLESDDPAAKKRLEALAEEAKRISDEAEKGVSQRDLQADIARLEEKIAAERMSLGSGEERASLEAAREQLASEPTTEPLARALGDHDLGKLDREVERLARTGTDEEKKQALSALEKATKAASSAGSERVAKALAEESARLEKLGATGEDLRSLSQALDALSKDGAKGNQLSPEDAGRIADALEKMTKQEREALLDQLKKQAKDQAALEALSERLKSGASESEKLRELANPAPSGGARLEKALAGAQAALGAPSPGGDGGASHDPLAAPTPRVRADSPSISVSPVKDPKVPLATLPGAGPRRPSSGSANARGVGALSDARAEEIGGVDREDVPEAYKDQLRRYFSPLR